MSLWTGRISSLRTACPFAPKLWIYRATFLQPLLIFVSGVFTLFSVNVHSLFTSLMNMLDSPFILPAKIAASDDFICSKNCVCFRLQKFSTAPVSKLKMNSWTADRAIDDFDWQIIGLYFSFIVFFDFRECVRKCMQPIETTPPMAPNFMKLYNFMQLITLIPLPFALPNLLPFQRFPFSLPLRKQLLRVRLPCSLYGARSNEFRMSLVGLAAFPTWQLHLKWVSSQLKRPLLNLIPLSWHNFIIHKRLCCL